MLCKQIKDRERLILQKGKEPRVTGCSKQPDQLASAEQRKTFELVAVENSV